MVFIIMQIRSGAKMLKPWYRCVMSESCTLSNVYMDFSSGKIDGGQSVPEEYLGAAVKASVGSKKTERIRVSCECTVEDVIAALRQYVSFSISMLPVVDLSSCTDTRADAMATLMSRALQRARLPDHWRTDLPNKKLKLKMTS